MHRLMFTLSILNLLSITVQKVILYFIHPAVFTGFPLAWFNRDLRILVFENIFLYTSKLHFIFTSLNHNTIVICIGQQNTFTSNARFVMSLTYFRF